MKIVSSTPSTFTVMSPLSTPPNVSWARVNRQMATNGEENLYRLTMRDLSVSKVNAKLQGIILTSMNRGVEFNTRKVWGKFCNRVLNGDITETTLKTIKKAMITWPADVQRMWKHIFSLKKECARIKAEADAKKKEQVSEDPWKIISTPLDQLSSS